MPSSMATARPCATRTSASGRPGPGRSCATRCAPSPSACSKLGLKRGERSPSSATTARASTATFAAVQSLGGIPVPVYQDSVADEMAYVLEHAEVKFAVVEDQEQVDKVISIADRLPKLQHDHLRRAARPQGLRPRQPAFLRARAGARAARSCAANAGADGWWLDEIAKGKGARRQRHALHLGHHRPAQGRDAHARQHRRLGAERQQVRRLHAPTTRCSPICRWPGSAITSSPTARPTPAAMCVCCPESPETVVEDRREIGPTYFFAPPRVFENLLTQIMVRMEDAGWLKKRMFHYFLGVARRCGEQILNGKPVGAQGPAALLARRHAGLRAAAQPHGLLAASRVAYTAGEAIGPELFRFYRSLGINLKQLYGQTEASVYITLQPDGEVYPDTVGKPGPDVEIKIADSGEVLFKSPGVFLKYYKNDEATQRHQDAGRLGAHRRCRLLRPARPPEDHRSRQGRRPAQQRRAVRAEVSREPHQVLSRDQGGGGLRPGPRLRDDVHQHRSDLGRQLGRAQQHRPMPATRSWRRTRRSTR